MNWRDKDWWFIRNNMYGHMTWKGTIATAVIITAVFGVIFLIAQHFNWYGLGE